MKKKKKLFNPKSKTTKLNKVFFKWLKERKTKVDLTLDLFKELNEIKWAGGIVGLLDVSPLQDLGVFSERKTDLLQREILSARTNKNLKISQKEFEEAMKLGEKENIARAVLNKFFAYKVFKKHACFYCFDECRIGFVFRGDSIVDLTLEAEIRKVFPQMQVYSHVFYNYAVNTLNKNSVQVSTGSNCKLAA